MFKLEAFNPEAEAKTLRLGDQLFHEAWNEGSAYRTGRIGA